MNIGLLSWCKILSLVLLCRLYLVACDHSGSTDDANNPDSHTSPLYSTNRNNSNRSGRRPKVIYTDRNKSEQRPRDSYRYRTRHHSGPRSRQVIDYRTINNPKMQVQNDEENPHTYSPRPRRGRAPPPRDRARTEYLKRKVLMLLDLNNTQSPYGYDVTFDGAKIICKALHPYLFGLVKRGNTTLWKPRTGDYPYKVVCRTKGEQESCKVFFPDYEKDYPPSKPTRVDVFKRVSGRQFGPEHWAGNLYYNTHAHMSPEMYGQSGQFTSPQHIPTGEVKPTPHTSLDVNPDESNLPQDETVAGDEAVAGDQPEQIDDSAQPQEGEQATEDIKNVDEGEGFKAEGPGVVPTAMPATIPAAAPGAIPGVMPGTFPGGIPRAYPGANPSETERASHVDLMSDYFNETFGPSPRPEFHPVYGYDMQYHSPRRHHRSSRRDYYNDMSHPPHRRHHRPYHKDYHDTSYHGSSPHDKYSHGTREFRDYPTAAYQPRPEPTIPVPPKRTDFKSQISPRDVVVHTDQSRQGEIDINVDRKKPENLVLTFATKSNVYVFDGSHHTFALNQTGGEPGTNDQNSGNNPQQRIIFNGEDPNRLSLDAGSVRISFPSQVIEGVPMPTSIHPGQNPASVQNSRPAGGASGNATINSNANASPPSSQPTNQQPVSQAPRQQAVTQQAARPQAVSQQPVTQQAARPQAVSQQPVTQQAARPQQAPAQSPPERAQSSEGQDSGVDIDFADN